MEIRLTLWCVLLANIPTSISSSTLPLPVTVPMINIPLYHRGMLNGTLNSSVGAVYYPHMDSMAEIYPLDDAYAIFLSIGTPVQIVLVRMDTGSPITWSQCDPCSSCYPMQRTPFITRSSSTFREIGCYSETCLIPLMRELFGNCTGWTCRYNVKYDKESTSFGTMVTDTLNFEASNTELKNFIMGCGDSYEGPFRTQFSGVLGLGRGPLSVQSQLNAKAFSFCLVSPGSRTPSSLKFYDNPPPIDQQHGFGNNSIMVPLSENSGYPYYYFVQFVGISINGFMLDVHSSVWGYGLNYDGGVIIDTGATATYLPSEAYNVFKSEIVRINRNLTRKPGHDELDFCYKDDPSNLYPNIEFHFENGNVSGQNFVSLKLSDDQMLFRTKKGTVCMSFVEGKGSALTVIGSNQLQGTQIMYDLVNEIVVVTYNKC